jgi:flagellar hook-associated protein 1 FlgK
MSLTGTLQIAHNALIANQVGLQVVGNNLANANTPDYVRQEPIFTPAPVQRSGNLLLGLGVQVTAVVQKIDLFLEERLRGSTSDVSGSEIEESAFSELESILGELSDTDLSTQLTTFFNSLHDVLNEPSSAAARNLVVLQGDTLTQSIKQTYDRVLAVKDDFNERIGETADDINRLTSSIASLNKQITTLEGGSINKSDAVGLRDERMRSLRELSQLIGIKTVEQDNGSVTVFVNGEFLVSEGQSREVTAEPRNRESDPRLELLFKDTNSPLTLLGGEAAGLIAARDQHLGGFLDRLDSFTKDLVFEFNKLHAGGQGLVGYSQTTSEFAVDDVDAPLDAAGLPYTPENGSFTVLVKNKQTGIVEETTIPVRLQGFADDTTLKSLVADLDGIDGVTATLGPDRKLKLVADSSDVEFSFGPDSSGALASLGVNTFFSGTGAADVSIRTEVKKNPSLVAASQDGIGQDTKTAELLAGLYERKLSSRDGASLADGYQRLLADVTQQSANVTAVADGFRTFKTTLEGQKLGQTGVNVDEEAVNMMQYQHAFQANAKLIQTISDLLDLLVAL